MPINEYFRKLNEQFKTGIATEHTYRGVLQNLINELENGITVTNEPRRQQFGAPDYIITKNDVPIGYIEAKDIDDSDLDGKRANKEQFNRYKESLENIIFTDYINFHWYIGNDLVSKIAIGDVSGNKIVPLKSNFNVFKTMLHDFCMSKGQPVKNPKKLAERMASSARLLADVIEKSLLNDIEKDEHTSLFNQLTAFHEILIHDITPKQFADVYAQTIAYGMFAARIYDKEPYSFNRFKVASNIPASNPFLKKFFKHITDSDPDDRIVWIIDNLAQFFAFCELEVILSDFGKSTKNEDPIIHLYEDFLAAYDPKLRKSRGVWYTPKPVVSFIVRSVDEILKTEFGLPMGFADNRIIKMDIKGTTKDFHKVQILDPATGTATFLVEIIKHIHDSFKGQQGIWSDYVDNHLIPRLNGFEFLMASYALAHLNIDLSLKDTGYKGNKNSRYRVFLTNSLENPGDKATQDAYMAKWLSDEAQEAEKVKTETPVMVIIGNPPYSGESANTGKWILNLINQYKLEPDSDERLNEKNLKVLNADENKFIRFAQYMVDNNKQGIIAFINPHGILDNPTFRGMRYSLMNSFDKIYILDLHGNSRKGESDIDGSVDQNVFDIQQGVCINIFIKKMENKKKLAKIYYADIFGKRNVKYDFLNNNEFGKISFTEIHHNKPFYFFVPKQYEVNELYIKGFQIKDLFRINSVGITTSSDSILIDFEKNEVLSKVNKHYEVNIKLPDNQKKVKLIQYRPFDVRHIYYDSKILGRARENVMKYMVHDDSLAIVVEKIVSISKSTYSDIFLSNEMIDKHTIGGASYLFPLYLWVDDDNLDDDYFVTRTPNLQYEIVEQIAEGLGLVYTEEKEDNVGTFAPIDLLDYIYAVLHSPAYREKYKEFLKIDFPRVPFPTDSEKFWQLVKLGGEIRELHLLESKIFENINLNFPIEGSGEVTRKMTTKSIGFELTDKANSLGKVWINDLQYFGDVPLIAWEFYIGGYQPAQKWLKDRHGRTLGYDEVQHYRKIIIALTETARVMQEIDMVGVE
ncbi:MAG: DNA methyltransferase [Ignavibacteriae bacterium HGW-Ignavibacteriae-1]|jgi:predicted helicase|nr:MAG: DNA methyltransferase [Ignavibacteriae bacterium HGW-Ignavibacteriae-1]